MFTDADTIDVVVADCSCASFSQLASSALLHRNAGADRCYESSLLARLTIYCRGTGTDEGVVAGDIRDIASLLLLLLLHHQLS